ncbi:AAA family ATPase [Acanthopleuribacter pedis]|uniref:ATP-dependent Clp protease ATP-binding subunit n=1 Tax=Acanthopleuribacter pedis TaxID=442870 RepID=A0A8J7Q5Z9_9BACT|nr:AAA family ATPase [Acanthopleuribacter pedis]MBO1317269.1 ATP-dependent Clp protease ATP-binding subunit [Acanthopleuribacter pedis]MBO1318576.1 ATP-dependent Clp protease ATP-binding subunit [Acanthopleuribacter pedis]
MNISLPIYVVRSRNAKNKTVSHRVVPLFLPFSESVRRNDLTAATNKLRAKLATRFHTIALDIHHKRLHWETFSPLLKTHTFSFKIELRRGLLNIKPLVVLFQIADKTLGLFPAFPTFWFLIPEDAETAVVCEEALTRFLRAEEKEELIEDPEEFQITGKEWITYIDFNLPTHKQERLALEERIFLGSREKPNGAVELGKVGTCLDWSEREVNKPFCHEPALEKLRRLSDLRPFPPIVLIGRPGVGKTKLIHQWIATRPFRENKNRGNTWHIAPQRLISGMSYVGQWEERLLEIITYMQDNQHFFYCDDLPGLFRAGLSAGSDLNVALVLKRFLDEGKLNFIGEITPERWRKLQEWDRGFADLFHCIRLEEPTPAQTFTTLLAGSRVLEHQHEVTFFPGALQQMMTLTRRFEGGGVFPGRGMALLEQVAKERPALMIKEAEVIKVYQQKSGLNLAFLDKNARLTREDVEAELGREVKGQDAAITAVTDIILRAKTRLNDPGKPFGTLLFLGPTGVGKTQLAKTCARFLYGDESKLLRFDMNEFNGYDATARLVGDFHNPNGLLTQAVRQSPFSLVLFDEIEKADPSVYDLLLQVLGEARLTDGNGMTVDFRNTIIILTSNLGAREAGNTLGFGAGQGTDAVYRGAARRFFRPEFFNRLDAVVPFKALERHHMRTIAEIHVNRLVQREGFKRRRCTITLDRRFLDALAEAGYHPQLGARALKRTLEQRLTFPLGRALSNTKPGAPMVLRIGAGADGGLSFKTYRLRNRPRRVFHAPVDEDQTALAQTRLERLAETIEGFAPEGETAIDHLSDAQVFYYSMRELWGQCRDLLNDLFAFEERLREPTHSPARIGVERPIVRDKNQIIQLPTTVDADRLLDEADTAALWRHWRDTYGPIEDPLGYRRLARRRRWWQTLALAEAWVADGPLPDERCLMLYLPLARGTHNHAATNLPFLAVPTTLFPGMDIQTAPEQSGQPHHGIFLQGRHAHRLAGLDQGVHVQLTETGPQLYLMFVVLIPAEVTDLGNWYRREWHHNHETVLEKAWEVTEQLPDGQLPDIVRYFNHTGVFDVGSGLFTPAQKPISAFRERAFLLNFIGREQGGPA